MCGEQNKQLLSNSNELLNEIIGDCDTPFIYEKTGVNIHHFLLDEFQDTSEMQWQNFTPLLRNSVADGHDNLIVGDAKQSIYHWRNSDWHILQEKVQSEFSDTCNLGQLNENWRSCKNIIDFNNLFFEYIRSKGGNDLTILYADNFLHYPKAKKLGQDGYVKVDFVEKEDFKAKALQRMVDAIKTLQTNNYANKDIMILVRDKTDARLVVNCLIDEQIPVVSDDALLLISSPCVRLLVTALRYMAHPDEVLNRGQIELLWRVIEPSRQLTASLADETPEMWENRLFGDCKLLNLRQQPLVKMVEDLVWLFDLPHVNNGSELAYVLAFQDFVFSFAQNQQADLAGFLECWDKKSCKVALPDSDTSDAVRVMTIHKSKGLASEAIIVPFLDEVLVDNTANKQPTLWCETANVKQKDFRDIPYVPIKGNSTVRTQTHFQADFQQEDLQRKIETVNLYYVAFTRAKKYLYIISQLNEKHSTPEAATTIADWLKLACQDTQLSVPDCQDKTKNICLKAFYNATADCLEMGKIAPNNKQTVAQSKDNGLHYYENREIPTLHEQYVDAHTQRGTLLHAIFAQIKQVTDVQAVVQRAVGLGQLQQNEMPKIRDYVNNKINSCEQTKDWFSGKYVVKNEVNILSKATHQQRPDRVMLDGNRAIIVDYKFGENMSDNYQKQVRNYMDLLNEMGYTTEGYLWYMALNQIVKVE